MGFWKNEKAFSTLIHPFRTMKIEKCAELQNTCYCYIRALDWRALHYDVRGERWKNNTSYYHVLSPCTAPTMVALHNICGSTIDGIHKTNNWSDSSARHHIRFYPPYHISIVYKYDGILFSVGQSENTIQSQNLSSVRWSQPPTEFQ